MRNIKLIIEYDGTNYSGWQRQLNAPSIQQAIEEAVLRITGEGVPVIGAGRTDSGVHARGQVANFFTSSSIPPERFSYALNSVLPKDIRILHSEEVPPDFHARYSAKGKRYRYSMVLRPHGLAIGSQYYYHVREPLRTEPMEKAAKILIGTHDFRAFQAKGSSAKTTVRTVYRSDLIWEEPYLYYDIQGNGFLYNMVRIIVGTLIEIGKGKFPWERMEELLKTGDRNLAGPTAPPHGLSLEEVYY